MKLKFEAGKADEGRKVYGVLRREMSLSATLIKRLKTSGGVTVGGTPVFMDYRLSEGDVVEAELSFSEREPDIVPEEGEISVLFENEGLIVVNKPAGMLVHPSRAKFEGTLAGLVAGYLLKTSGSAVCHAVNRLDRDTSGVVLFSKSAHFKTLAINALSAPESIKEYTAFLCGELPKSGTIDAPIARLAPPLIMRVVSPEGQRAVTHFETVGRAEIYGEEISHVRLVLETGRTHQIRVHCAHMDAPLIGDKLYGNEKSFALSEKLGVNSQLLHAGKLCFKDPVSGDFIEVSAPIVRGDMLDITGMFK